MQGLISYLGVCVIPELITNMQASERAERIPNDLLHILTAGFSPLKEIWK